MSWQSYVDDHLMCGLNHGGTLTSAAIYGHDGVLWASSPAFPTLSDTEYKNIFGGFTDPGSLAQAGLYLGGAKYMMIMGENGVVIRGKKGLGGLTIKKTATSLVIGIYDEPVQPADCNMVVENLGDYLIGQGY